MLMNLHKKLWTRGLTITPGTEHITSNEVLLSSMASMSDAYAKRVADEENASAAALAIMGVGKVDPKKKLEADVSTLVGNNIVQCVGTMLGTVVF